MNKGLIVGLGVLGGLLLLSGSSSAAPQPTPTPSPTPPPSAPKPKPTPAAPPPVTAADVKYSTWFNYATGQADPNAPGFLTWGPGQDGTSSTASTSPGTTPMPAKPTPAPPALPKAGERWQFTFALNRPLSFFEMSAAKGAFSAQIPDQHLDGAMQNATSSPPTVTITTTYTRDATSKSFPIGYTISKSGITATVSSARRVA